MKKSTSSLLFSLLILLSLPLYAKTADLKEKNQLNFSLKLDELKVGQVYYSFNLSKKDELFKKFPQVESIDFTQTLFEKASFLYNKIAYVIDKPIGYFNKKRALSESYNQRMLKDFKVTKLKKADFLAITTPWIFFTTPMFSALLEMRQ